MSSWMQLVAIRNTDNDVRFLDRNSMEYLKEAFHKLELIYCREQIIRNEHRQLFMAGHEILINLGLTQNSSGDPQILFGTNKILKDLLKVLFELSYFEENTDEIDNINNDASQYIALFLMDQSAPD